MRVVGLITEYNPFHNGHLHHLHASLRSANADASVAIMSGHFLQRGEPALVDKWVRTEMALAAGVDLVLELPFPFACNSAPHFARGAIRSLQSLGVVDALCFGSESGNLHLLDRIAAVLVDWEKEIETQTAARLRDGVNFPTARAEALRRYAPDLSKQELASPNNILGIEYLRALSQTSSSIEPYSIKRLGPGYHDTNAVGEIASATGIRKRIADGDAVDVLVPGACRKLLGQALSAGHVLDLDKLFVALQAHLLQGVAVHRDLYQVNDGVDRRLNLAALKAGSFAELVSEVKSKQWTMTRVQRVLMYVLMQAKSAEMQAFLQAGPLYLRVLGHGEKGRRILARARKKKSLPVISDPARANSSLRKFYLGNEPFGQLAVAMLHYDLRATQLHSLLQFNSAGEYRNRDFYQQVRRV